MCCHVERRTYLRIAGLGDTAGIERYLDKLDAADQAAPAGDARPIKDKIAALEEEMDRLKKL